ncbi:hypothetical protein A3G67_03060 [Candidatus Roizmanbacteria bacterium RIFCSPLOWO2_12_FULL_40_12]|uniref:Beta-xylosidase C-terminal Concanavalin A-like domain-containing protein n=1 Tax=Candidatus Roizmanbacteria bacterium RIFCSPLOWO2_01_FULL_40_42 TaxID=1802066 RepID=A0A1F7J5D0_9BACT|nr:MAG: hypothetical protein A2779_02695 [Candidatus Roizmanbacteria bacterium RIFCSPHIGHO2_01_FULL_40_98]OGK28253.1 MAG: hypothetical protein A3C31_00060 [Candidatus Roizmanbacteria bacterium RIFCSPHIGHO2_02_FULL_40_53]OGK30489.1 MAG: hypothetical protein A2W49_02745 [Candidatus Roizmanbacteria bacterium RIFCSPHIGHO2_12_41_18]OGK36903.1 MAG: hypothetical protein A3E69_00320 [Candidatus Roizmanbacteria bacterium RIFCSPHIGHO2_12_FULL_40_130]OGK50809.1 MAG: hypothetical protein A3B50_00830 [Candi
MSNTKKMSSIIFYIFIITFIFLAYVKKNEGLTAFFLKKATIASKNIVGIGYNKKEYKVDYPKKLDKTASELSGFEKDEEWNGDYVTDEENYWEGKTSYVVSSKNNKPTIISLQKYVDLSGYTSIKMLVYSDKEDIESIKKFQLRLGNKDNSSSYEYDIRTIKPGWNIIQISKDKFTFVSKFSSENKSFDNQIRTGNLLFWNKIEKISIELDSLPKSQVEVTVDRLWAEKSENYKTDFNSANDSMISAKTYGEKTYINIWDIGGKSSLFSEITSAKDFIYTAKIIPQKPGAFGISGRADLDTNFGYYLEVGGIGLSSWQLYKIGKTVDNSAITQLDNGLLSNLRVKTNEPIWLRISTSGNKIAGYLSTNGVNFTKLSEKRDDEIESGGIGTHTSNASFLLESIEFRQ